MKSILFTVLKDKLLSGEKDQTYRLIYIPKYIISEEVNIDFKDNGLRETLFQAVITDLYPRQMKDLTLEEAHHDGFLSIKDFKTKLIEMHNIKKNAELHWGFIIRFKKASNTKKITDFIENPEISNSQNKKRGILNA